jgi:uncharacterized Zn finger protein
MRFSRPVLDRFNERIVQMGLSSCPICGSGSMQVLRGPTVEFINGIPHDRDHPNWDPDANVLFLVHVECNMCGHVLLFNSERLEPSSTKSLVVGMSDEEEEAYLRESGEA